MINIKNLPKYSFLPNWEIENLVGDIDLFVNFISFQEMEPQIVKNYAENYRFTSGNKECNRLLD